MATRKHRRRREKGFRHEYVWEDGEGNPLDPAEVRPEKTEAKPQAKGTPAKGAKGGARAAREVKPASWNRVARRALIFAPLILVFAYITDKNHTRALTTAVIFIAIFVPFSYMLDSVMYRSYLKRTNQPPKPTGKGGAKGK